jgi:hypothetical protein
MNNYEKLKTRIEEILGKTLDVITEREISLAWEHYVLDKNRKYLWGMDGSVYVFMTMPIYEHDYNPDDDKLMLSHTPKPEETDQPVYSDGVVKNIGYKLDLSKPLNEQSEEGNMLLDVIYTTLKH